MEHKTSKQIADELNRRGLRNGPGRPWYERAVAEVRCREGLRSGPGPEALRPPYRRADGLYTARGVAARLGVSVPTVSYWVQQGWLVPAERSGRANARWFELDPTTIARLETIKQNARKAPPQRADGLYSVRGIAERLGVSIDTVRAWIAHGRLKPRSRNGRGHPSWFKLDPKTLARLETLKLDHAHTPGQDLLPDQRADGLYSARGVAARLGVPMTTVRYWIARGWLRCRRGGGRGGRPSWFRLSPATLARLHALKRRHRRLDPDAGSHHHRDGGAS
jgi:DNA-binding transcriptional MerR regulator